jgi:hypothetical protein
MGSEWPVDPGNILLGSKVWGTKVSQVLEREGTSCCDGVRGKRERGFDGRFVSADLVVDSVGLLVQRKLQSYKQHSRRAHSIFTGDAAHVYRLQFEVSRLC